MHGFKYHARLTFMRINLKMPNNNEDLVVDNNNYYIYKDSWIEKFNKMVIQYMHYICKDIGNHKHGKFKRKF